MQMNIWLNMQVVLYTSRFACFLGDGDNTGLLTGHMQKYFHQLLQILGNWDESLKINTNKDLLFCSLWAACRNFGLDGTSDMLDDDLRLISWILENNNVG